MGRMPAAYVVRIGVAKAETPPLHEPQLGEQRMLWQRQVGVGMEGTLVVGPVVGRTRHAPKRGFAAPWRTYSTSYTEAWEFVSCTVQINRRSSTHPPVGSKQGAIGPQLLAGVGQLAPAGGQGSGQWQPRFQEGKLGEATKCQVAAQPYLVQGPLGRPATLESLRRHGSPGG